MKRSKNGGGMGGSFSSDAVKNVHSEEKSQGIAYKQCLFSTGPQGF